MWMHPGVFAAATGIVTVTATGYVAEPSRGAVSVS